jgi:PPOX class probable F420-dependent enzyme
MATSIARDLSVSREELLNFIRPRHHGILVTERRDGRPQTSPVTMGVDSDDRVVVSSYPERAKSKNAARSAQASVCVLSNEFSGEWVQLDGRIEVV